MITKVLGPLVFATTLIAGIYLSSFIPVVQSILATAVIPVTKPLGFAPEYKTYPDGKVKMEYLGEKLDEGTPYLHFRIVNRTEKAVTYSSEFNEGPEHYVLEVDGFLRPSGYFCGNGREERTLYSGYSVDIKVSRMSFVDSLPETGGNVRVGYYIGGLGEKRELIFSDSLWVEPTADELDWQREAFRKAN